MSVSVLNVGGSCDIAHIKIVTLTLILVNGDHSQVYCLSFNRLLRLTLPGYAAVSRFSGY